MEQREAAQATADELGQAAGMEAYLIDCALDALRASAWPGNLDMQLPSNLPPDRRHRWGGAQENS